VRSAERECVGLHVGVENLDDTRVLADIARLTNKLIQPLFADDASTTRIEVQVVVFSVGIAPSNVTLK
jgi:hypothetical protein